MTKYFRISTWKKGLKKILRSPVLLLITAIILVLAATLLFANKGLWRHIALRTEVSGLQQQRQRLAAQESSLQHSVQLLQSEDRSLIERIAREKYSMIGKNEHVYILAETK
jgi:cell division protein FtsB